MKVNKKGQGLGGLLTVIIVGFVFFSFFPFFYEVFKSVAALHSPVLAALIILVPFLVIYFFASFAFNLGEGF